MLNTKTMLAAFFALTTAVFAGLAAYLSFKRERQALQQGNANNKKAEDIASEERMHVIVHELRAPITAIKGAASLLLSKSIGEADRDKMLHVIFDSSREMLARISEILDSAKVEEGKFAIKKVKSDLSVIIKEHIDVFSYAAKEKGIALIFEPTDISQFYFDPGRIGQVINNLISNSLKFTKQGGKIEVKIQAKGQEIQVEISDNGIGIPEGKKPLLFTKFGQIDHGVASGPGEEESSGLGLFISKQIIEAHGGEIWIESPAFAPPLAGASVGKEESVRTKVFFTLPFIQEEEPSSGVVVSDSGGAVSPGV